jgi:tetratricopeptide (TPR) repeat protein
MGPSAPPSGSRLEHVTRQREITALDLQQQVSQVKRCPILEQKIIVELTMRVFRLTMGVAIVCYAAAAGAAEPTARELYEQGAQAYLESRHDQAATLFRKAFELEPHAELAYNLGRALEAAGHLRSAVQSFRDYLRLSPEAKDRAEVERRIANLERRVDASRTSPATAPARAAPESSTPSAGQAPAPSTPSAAPSEDTPAVQLPTWLAFGVSAGALGAAVGFELARRSAVEDVKSASTQLEHRERYEAAETRRDLARVFAGVGAAAALTGGVLLYFDLGGQPAGRRGDARAFGVAGRFRF